MATLGPPNLASGFGPTSVDSKHSVLTPMHKPHQRKSRLTLAAILLTSLAFVAGAEPTRTQPAPHLREVLSCFQAPLSHASQRAFKKLGPNATQAVFEVIAGRERTPNEPFDVQACKELAHSVLASWPHEEVIAELLSSVNSGTPVGQRIVLLEMLAWTDSASALPALFKVLDQLNPEELYSQRVKAELEHALRALLKDSPHRFRKLEPLLPGMPLPLISTVLKCAGEDSSPEAGKLLAHACKRNPAAERLVLECIASCQPSEHHWNPQDFQLLARRALNHQDLVVRRLGVIALGKLADPTAFAELIEVLERAEGSLYRTTLKALQLLSGMNRDWDADRWQEWLANEQERFAADRELAYGLASAEASSAVVTIGRLTTHKFFASDASELINRALNNSNPLVRKLACNGFCALESHQAVPALILQLDDVDESVHNAAHAALCKLTARDLGDTRAEWEDWWNDLR